MAGKVKREPGDTKWVLAGLTSVPAMALITGWAISMMWGWFVVPIGAASIGVLHATGLATTVRLVMGLRPAKDPVEGETFMSLFMRMWSGAAADVLVVFIGWCVAWWMS